MKTNYFLIIFIVAVFISCSEDSETNSDLNTEAQILKRVEKFAPSLIAYQSNLEGSYKNVKYYNNQLVFADTTFYAQSNVYDYKTYTYSSNIHTIMDNTGTGSLDKTKEYTFDSEGRLIKKVVIMPNSGNPGGSTSIETYTYSGNIITCNAVDPYTNLVMPDYVIKYITNSDGYISSVDYSTAQSNIVYEGTKPVQYSVIYDGGLSNSIYFTYYSNPLPVIFQRTVHEINNSFFEDFEERVADNCNYYLKSYVNHVNFEKEFDSENYIQYAKAIGSLNQEIYDSESFYYYE